MAIGLSVIGGNVEGGVEKALFGTTKEGIDVESFTLTNANGCAVKIITYGATITELSVPDRDGDFVSVVQGSDSLEAYEGGFPAASVIGRVANRIAGARFSLDGIEYRLAENAGPNHLHGGQANFARRVWQAEILEDSSRPSVRLTYHSADGEEGYPGNLAVTVTYSLLDDNTLRLEYSGKTDKATPLNLTNHAYFNLDNGGEVRKYLLSLDADRYTVFDSRLIPTGEIRSVKDTALDFTQIRQLGERASEIGKSTRYDHNFVLNHDGDPLSFKRAARVVAKSSGRTLEVWTTEPGMQLYTSPLGKDETPRLQFLCLETQHYPDSINQEHFPSVVLRPGEVFRSVTEFRFGVE